MEKFQIAKYGMMQVTALVYGILASGTAVKINKGFADQGHVMPSAYYHAIFFRDYGVWFLGIVIIWAIAVAYLSSSLSKWDFEESNLSASGIMLAVLFAILGTFIAFAGAIAPLQ